MSSIAAVYGQRFWLGEGTIIFNNSIVWESLFESYTSKFVSAELSDRIDTQCHIRNQSPRSLVDNERHYHRYLKINNQQSYLTMDRDYHRFLQDPQPPSTHWVYVDYRMVWSNQNSNHNNANIVGTTDFPFLFLTYINSNLDNVRSDLLDLGYNVTLANEADFRPTPAPTLSPTSSPTTTTSTLSTVMTTEPTSIPVQAQQQQQEVTKSEEPTLHPSHSLATPEPTIAPSPRATATSSTYNPTVSPFPTSTITNAAKAGYYHIFSYVNPVVIDYSNSNQEFFMVGATKDRMTSFCDVMVNYTVDFGVAAGRPDAIQTSCGDLYDGVLDKPDGTVVLYVVYFITWKSDAVDVSNYPQDYLDFVSSHHERISSDLQAAGLPLVSTDDPYFDGDTLVYQCSSGSIC